MNSESVGQSKVRILEVRRLLGAPRSVASCLGWFDDAAIRWVLDHDLHESAGQPSASPAGIPDALSDSGEDLRHQWLCDSCLLYPLSHNEEKPRFSGFRAL